MKKRMENRPYEVVKSMEFNGDILITDPCYVIKDGDWKKSGYGDLMSVGITKSITNSTLYGDWSCTVWKASDRKSCNSKTVVGEFCADAGLVSVMDLAQAVEYNPEIIEWIKDHSWCATVIRDFNGIVEMRKYDNGIFPVFGSDFETYHSYDLELFFIVDGEVRYIAAQTGL